MPDWIKVGLRHFATASAIVAVMWWIGVPRVQAFINDTVNDRMLRIESTLVTMLDRLDHLNRQLDRIEQQLKPKR